MINKQLLKKEFKQAKTMLTIWSIVIFSLSILFMLIFFAVRNNLKQGNGIVLIDSSADWFAAIAKNLYLIWPIFASILGITLLGKEVREQYGEYLYSMPLSRQTVWATKMCFGVLAILIVNLLFAVVMTGMTIVVGVPDLLPNGSQIGGMFMYFGLNIVMQLVIFLFCFGLGSALNKRASLGLSIAIGIGFFVVNIIIGVLKAFVDPTLYDILTYLCPLNFADSMLIMSFVNGKATVNEFAIYTLIAVPWILLCFGLTWWGRRKFMLSDLA
ncbi:MAG: ABC transporter permease subunit [Clostridiales bacterium]|jgi:ABC-type transport system involved in multi-copper enzyme maturation permease subunit|nr:ABC transporter permease subunit [Clostridiales bacterium]